MTDADWLARAADLADAQVGRTAPNPAVGAVCVRDGRLLGEGAHLRAGGPHAEVNCLNSCTEDPAGATLYVTLEPCSTTGRTPPCCDLIRAKRLGRVVIGCLDPNPRHAGRAVDLLREAGIAVDVAEGPIADRCRALIAPFAKAIVAGLPYLRLKLALTLDGFIADLSGEEREKASLKRFLSENSRAVILKTNKVSEAYATLWELDWRELIAAHTDARTAEAMGNMSKGQPMTVLADAYSIFVSADVVASLPEFKKPGQITMVADKMAKAAKVGGGNMVVETVGKTPLKDGKSRVVAAAFALATGMDAPVKLSADELDFAQYLVPFARSVIDAQGEKYRDAMNTLLTASSAGEKV